MSLVMQECPDGYRVVRDSGGHEQMVARVKSNREVSSGSPEYAAKLDEHIAREMLAGATPQQVAEIRSAMPVFYVPLPSDECTVHSAIGPLSVADLKEILSHL